MITALTAQSSPDQLYRPPTATERDQALAATNTMLGADLPQDTVTAFAELGFDARSATDPTTGRPYRLAVSRPGDERSWGALVVDLGAPHSLLIEVPHTRSDELTEDVGLELFRAVPGSVLVLAGAHRRADGGHADVAHETDSLFHAMATRMADQGLSQLQLHGYADDNAPGEQAVVSAGVGDPAAWAKQVAEKISTAGLDVCRAWQGGCDSLAGRTNVQGIAAAAKGQPFTHLEISRRVRDDAGQRTTLVTALAAAAASSTR